MTHSEDKNQPTPTSTAEPEATAKKSPLTFMVVGIGASAGGLESLESFFKNVTVDSGMAYIIIQHLSPDFKSMMDELLARHTEVPIHRVEEGMTVERDNVYLLPPKKEMIISWIMSMNQTK
jgi:two-component system CheB/CheR fusion protein